MSFVAILRGYRGDALVQNRRAIETAAIAFRISRHNDLAAVWLRAATSDDSHRQYREAFEQKKLFPKKGNPDYHPLLSELYSRFDLASKLVHSGVLSNAGHISDDMQGRTLKMLFMDLGTWRDVVAVLFASFNTHLFILRILALALEPTSGKNQEWLVDFKALENRIIAERDRWIPNLPNGI